MGKRGVGADVPGTAKPKAITVASATGEGPTPLAAFDAALHGAGIANYNLIVLSSVIPPNAILKRGVFGSREDEYGDRLYVVMARCFASEPGTAAWSGLGWMQEERTGRGLFVELHGDEERKVTQAISDTLEAMRSTREISYGPVETEIVGITCRSQPVCAVVVAVYQSEGWQ